MGVGVGWIQLAAPSRHRELAKDLALKDQATWRCRSRLDPSAYLGVPQDDMRSL